MSKVGTISLDDKYLVETGNVFLTGTQALVRLPMLQRARDLRHGLNTAGFISGYRGSPLGSYDRELWRAKAHLARSHIHFTPGVNEELAATAVWGCQQAGSVTPSRYEGVFGLWYGKGPGLDRASDAIRHANAAGVSPRGGVLAVVGDDHTVKSSTQPAHSEPTFADLQIPVLFPSDLGEIITYGLMGWEMSRYTGCWVGLKVLADTMDSSGTVSLDVDTPRIIRPASPPRGNGVHLRWPDPWADGEVRFHRSKLPAILEFAKENKLNRVFFSSERPRLGIIASGKSWSDLRQALVDLGLDEPMLQAAGIRLIKLAMPWPLDDSQLREFCAGLEQVLVIEEKRQLIENALRSALYVLPDAHRPIIIGQYDQHGTEILPRVGEHNPDRLARIIAALVKPWTSALSIDSHLARLAEHERLEAQNEALPLHRAAYFCSGCPHNSSTKVPEGSRAIAGIGCHYMAVSVDTRTTTFTQMGGEGANWIGQAPFVDETHVFANVGDGTYFHSASLAIRACIAAKMTMTFKLLYNDAVAMTGGQPLDGVLTVPQLAQQLLDEGVTKVVVVADDPKKYSARKIFPRGVDIRSRAQLDSVQRQLRTYPSVTALIYDQVCAAEKRRRRKRKEFPDPDRRVFINRAVCEGCGDCSKASNCVSIVPIETEFGLRRRIDQSSCNKDFSCVEGFCPSFVVVEGAKPRRRVRPNVVLALGTSLPVPDLAELPQRGSYGILVTGIGGTGVVTIGAIVGMAAHIEGISCRLVDYLGMAQKGGAVVTHLRLSRSPEDLVTSKLNCNSADVLLGCDLLGAAESSSLKVMRMGAARAVINTEEAPTSAFTLNPDLRYPAELTRRRIERALGKDRVEWVEAGRIAGSLFGDTIASNMLMLGYAWQLGLIPVGLEALVQAIELNGVAVEENKLVFMVGRILAARPLDIANLAELPVPMTSDLRRSAGFEEQLARREAYLTAYQDSTYARRYRQLIGRVQTALAEANVTDDRLARAVAESYFRLLAYKDEFEVARLYAAPEFREQLEDELGGARKIRVLLAPPLLSRPNQSSGVARKFSFGPWIFPAMRLLASLRWLRGTRFNPFGYSTERRMERALIADFELTVDAILAHLKSEQSELLVELASLPQMIRGYGHVKQRSVDAYRAKLTELLGKLALSERRAAA
jgi:indolepyruvate ferredoxin oxidoreductase